MATFRLADAPQLFHFKMNEKVVNKGSDGYADPDYSGLVVGGTWTGDPSIRRGSHTVSYRIKRDRGGYFDATELELLKRFEDEASLRAEIRERLRTYKLPRTMPEAPTGDLEKIVTVQSPLGGEICSACDHPIRPRDAGAIKYTYPDRSAVRFHGRCNTLWREEKVK